MRVTKTEIFVSTVMLSVTSDAGLHYIDCKLINIGAMRYINVLTISGLRAWCCNSSEL